MMLARCGPGRRDNTNDAKGKRPREQPAEAEEVNLPARVRMGPGGSSTSNNPIAHLAATGTGTATATGGTADAAAAATAGAPHTVPTAANLTHLAMTNPAALAALLATAGMVPQGFLATNATPFATLAGPGTTPHGAPWAATEPTHGNAGHVIPPPGHGGGAQNGTLCPFESLLHAASQPCAPHPAAGPSDGQRAFLNDLGVTPPEIEGMTHANASLKISELKPLLDAFKAVHGTKWTSGRQRHRASSCGIDLPSNMTSKDCQSYLEDQLKSAGRYTRDDAPTEPQLSKIRQLKGPEWLGANTPSTKAEAFKVISDAIAAKRGSFGDNAPATAAQKEFVCKLDPAMGERVSSLDALTKGQAKQLISTLLAKKSGAKKEPGGSGGPHNAPPPPPPPPSAGGAGATTVGGVTM